MKKILFLLPSIRGGGAERVVLDVIRNLDRGKFSPSLFLIQKDGVYWDEVPEDIDVHYAIEAKDSVLFNAFSIIKTFYKAAAKQDVLVGSLELYTTYLVQLIGTFLNKKTIGWVHINIEKRLSSMNWYHKLLNIFAIKVFYPYLSAVICVSKGAADSLNDIINYPSNKLHVIYNPIDFTRIELCAKEIINIPFLKPTEQIIISIGRLEQQKNHPLLLRTYKLLKDQGITSKLVILGEGPEYSDTLNLAQELGINEDVFLVGFQDNPYAWLKRASVFVCSSNFEGFPIVLLEAMRLQIPIVSTDCPSGPAEMLENGRHGVLVPVGDEIALADAINIILRNPNDAKVKKMTESAYLRTNEFDAQKVVSNFEKLFHNIT